MIGRSKEFNLISIGMLVALFGSPPAWAKCAPFSAIEIKGAAPTSGQVCAQFRSMTQGTCASVAPDGTWSAVVYYPIRTRGGLFGDRCSAPPLKNLQLYQIDGDQVRLTHHRVHSRDIDYDSPVKSYTLLGAILDEFWDLPGPTKPLGY